jgi:hypothetical protein
VRRSKLFASELASREVRVLTLFELGCLIVVRGRRNDRDRGDEEQR